MKKTPESSPEQELIKVFEAAGMVDFMEYLQSGKRLMWLNFKAGVAKGFGVTVGMTVVLAIAIWILTLLVDLPLVGAYFAQAKQVVTEYVDSTNYQDEFEEMNGYLREMVGKSQDQQEPVDDAFNEELESVEQPSLE